MSNILLISYYFPPVGGAGAQRPVKFAHYLRQLGHTTVVLTGSGETGGLWTPSDPTLGLDVPPETKVVRVQGPEPHSSGGVRNRTARLARLQSDWSRWWRSGIVAEGARLDNIDVVYAIMSPYSSAEASLALSNDLGVGWIADLGDPWALDEMMVYPTGLHRRLEIARMRRLLGTAAAIVMSTPEAAYQLVQEFPELAGRRVVSITNGYDAADFADVQVAATDPTKFRIVHTGYLHTELGLQERQRKTLRRVLGGATPGVDILTRSHVYLLEAVDRLLERDPSLGERLEVHFAGVLSETDRRLAARSPVTVLHGYLSHADSIALMRSADLLFLPMQNLPAGRRSTTVPGKTYEYLASGRPILGAVPPGDARDTLTRIGHVVCDPDDTTAIAQTIATALSGRKETRLSDTGGAEFAYDTLARRAGAVIEAVSSNEVSPPAVAARQHPAAHSEHELRVLLLAYHFPPIGGAGAQASLKLARYLPEHGCRPIVVTGPGTTHGRWTPTDDTLQADLPSAALIARVAPPEPARPTGWRGRSQRMLRSSSEWSRWWIDGVLQTSSAKNDIDVIVASASPYETIEAAAKLAHIVKRPWIAVLRDPWALDEMMVYPTGLHRRLEIARMRRLLGTAAAIVMNTPEAAYQLVQEFPELAGRRVVSITNGYDAADFADVQVAATDPTKFRIVHTGYLHTELGLQERQRKTLRRVLGGATPGVDILTRSHVYLLEAVDRLLERDPSLGERLEVHFAGVLSETDRRLAARSPVTVLHGYLSHADSIALMRSADLLFLPMQNLPAGRRSTTVPGKTYEYLASGRPILGAVPPGDARDTLTRIGHVVCDPDDTTAIAQTIATALAQGKPISSPPDLDWEIVRSFERSELAAQLAQLVRLVVPETASVEARAVSV